LDGVEFTVPALKYLILLDSYSTDKILQPITREEAASPIAETEATFITELIEAKQHRDIMT